MRFPREYHFIYLLSACFCVELSNNLSEQMMCRIKMNLKNACSIGSEISAKHNAFMFSVIESCKMIKLRLDVLPTIYMSF